MNSADQLALERAKHKLTRTKLRIAEDAHRYCDSDQKRVSEHLDGLEVLAREQKQQIELLTIELNECRKTIDAMERDRQETAQERDELQKRVQDFERNWPVIWGNEPANA